MTTPSTPSGPFEEILYEPADPDGIARVNLHRPDRLDAFTNRMQRERERRTPTFPMRVPTDLPPMFPWWDQDERSS